MNGGLLFVLGVLILLVAGYSHFALDSSPAFTLPLVVGGIASIVFGFYQRWWVRNVFE